MKKVIKALNWWWITFSFAVFVAVEVSVVYCVLRYIGVLPS